jgi:hypothetical protein
VPVELSAAAKLRRVRQMERHMGFFKRIYPPDDEQEERLERWFSSPEGKRQRRQIEEANRRAHSAVVEILRHSNWGSAGDVEFLAAEVVTVVATGTDRHIADYLRQNRRGTTVESALREFAGLIAELRLAVASAYASLPPQPNERL